MKFKEGVPNDTLDPIMYVALDIAEQVYKAMLEMVITSTSDGVHIPTSYHYRKPKARAADIRTRYLSADMKQAIFEEIKKRLPKGFQIVLEGDHFHVEYDPDQRRVNISST